MPPIRSLYVTEPPTQPTMGPVSTLQRLRDLYNDTLKGFVPADLVKALLPSQDVTMPLTTILPGAAAGEFADQQLAEPVRRTIKAYHGSPHDFDQFSLSKIGTGEGAQTYGHGLYFAEHPEVAQQYKQETRGRYLDTATGNLVDSRKISDPTEIGTGKRFQPAKGRTYEVNIHASPDELLDWDKPLSQQPPKVQEALEKLAKENPYSDVRKYEHSVGRHAYEAISSSDPEYATEQLKKAGIKGIQYLDQGSRSAGEGTKNFVIFDDKIIEIAKKYGISLPIAASLYKWQQSQQSQKGVE